MIKNNILLLSLKKFFFKNVLPQHLQGFKMGTGFEFSGDLDTIQVGRKSSFEAYSLVENSGGKIEIGAHFRMGRSAIISSYGGKIKIGDSCTLNPFSVLYGHGNLTIGNNVRIAAHTVIVPANHIFSDKTKLISQQGLTKLGVEIGDDVWIGAGVKILDGVKIGSGSIVAAGAVVTKSFGENSIIGGIPAKLIGIRGE